MVGSNGQLQAGADCRNFEETRASDDGPAPFRFDTVMPGDVSPPPLRISKTGPAGEALWTWTFDETDKAGLVDALVSEDGGLIGAGYIIRKGGAKMHGYDALLFRLDANGNEKWRQIFASDKRDVFADIAALCPTEFYVVGHTGGGEAPDWNPWIIRMGIDGRRPGSTSAAIGK